MVEARIQKAINLTAVQPIRRGDSAKDWPAEQREGGATSYF